MKSFLKKTILSLKTTGTFRHFATYIYQVANKIINETFKIVS